MRHRLLVLFALPLVPVLACVGDDDKSPSAFALPDASPLDAALVDRDAGATGADGGAVERDASPTRDADPDVVDASVDDAADAAVTDAADGSVADAGPSGQLDLTFNGTGYEVFALPADGGTIGYANAVALDSTGRILVGGYQGGPGAVSAAVWRLGTTGALDGTFGSGGVWTKTGTAAGAYDSVSGLAVDPTDRVVATGQSNNGSPIYQATWRLTTSGALDTSFATKGFVTQTNTLGSGAYDLGNAVLVDGEGKVTVAGFSKVSASTIDLCAWRYTAAGVLDTANFASPSGFFSEHGAANPTASPFDTAAAATFQGLKVVMVGTSYTGTTTAAVVARITAGGALDTTFNGTGRLVLKGIAGGSGATAYDSLSGVQTDGSGRIIVAGSSEDGAGVFHPFVMRLLGDGSPDSSFGTAGKVILPFPAGTSNAFGGALARDGLGRFVVIGGTLGPSGMAVWRVSPDGVVDPSFGTGGVFTMTGTSRIGGGDAGPPNDVANGLAIDAQNRPVVVGASLTAGMQDVAVVWRLTP
ncbi:MAG: hypothetical protein U0235_27955 [Polyangiaceae bacterium]